jgi:hypothetical protein
MTSITKSEKAAPVPLMMWPRTQVMIGTLMFSTGAFLSWSRINPVDGAMMLISGTFLAGTGAYKLLRGAR